MQYLCTEKDGSLTVYLPDYLFTEQEGGSTVHLQQTTSHLLNANL